MNNFLKLGNVDVTALCDVYGAQIERAKQTAAARQDVHRPPPAARGEGRRRRPHRRARSLAPRHHHRRAERRQGRLRREAADAQDRRRPGHRQGGARQQARLPGRHAAALGPALPAGQAGVLRHQASSARSRSSAPGGTATRTICAGRRRRLQTQPADLDWARFLGPLKWRDWDPQQFYNWRAYLDFGGGQITDLFTHWIDVVHMFMGDDIPIAASASGGVYTTRTAAPRPTRSTCCSNTRRSSPRPSRRRSPRASAAPASSSAAPRDGCGSRAAGTSPTTCPSPARQPRRPPLLPSRTGQARRRRPAAESRTAAADRGRPGLRQHRPGSHPELPGLRRLAQAAERRRAHRPSLGAGLAPRQHRVSREAAHRLRPDARADSAGVGGRAAGHAPDACPGSICARRMSQAPGHADGAADHRQPARRARPAPSRRARARRRDEERGRRRRASRPRGPAATAIST